MNTIIEKIRAEVEHRRDLNYKYYLKQGITSSAEYRYDEDVKILSIISGLENSEKPTNPTIQGQPVKTDIIEDLKHYLATTPKEQIEKDWESLKEWGKVGLSVSEFLGWEQPVCEGLEDEIREFVEQELDGLHDNDGNPLYTADYLEYIARHFYELGCRRTAEKYDEIEYKRQRAEESVPKDLEEAAGDYASDGTGFIDMTAYRAVIAGAKWQKEQMMKEAVEGKIYGDIKDREDEPYEIWAESYSLPKDKFHLHENVKLVIIKED